MDTAYLQNSISNSYGLFALHFRLKSYKMDCAGRWSEMVKVSAAGDFDAAIALAKEYLKQLRQEQKNAEESN